MPNSFTTLMPFLAGRHLSSLSPFPGSQTRVVHKRCPVKLLFIMSLCALSRFSHPPGVSRGSITAPAVEGAKTFLSRFTSVCQRKSFHLHRSSQQAATRPLWFSPLSEMGTLFPFVGKRALVFAGV